MPTWATIVEVQEITGVTVTEPQLSQAGEVIDIYANRTQAAIDAIGARDRGWLKAATAWQAIWQKDQPGYGSRQQVKQVVQDGAQVVYTDSTEANSTAVVMLAPLAARALRNLSWKADRTRRVRHVRERLGRPILDEFLEEASDDWHPWTPLGVG